MFFNRFLTIFRTAGFGRQDSQDSVRVTHGRHFRVSGDDRFISEVKRHQRTGFDTCRGVADNEIEFHFLQFFEDLFNAFASQSVFITRLGSRQDKEVLGALIFYHRLV
ncbi:hypothetical protein D3C80_1458270 [compost metagenome]